MGKTEELRPCPLCNVSLFHNGSSELGDIYEHPNNGCAMQVAWFTATPEWIEKWNRRSDEQAEVVAWACVKCNSPRSVDPCPKCGTPLTKPADGWEWPTLPDIGRIRELAREVGYAIGVHGSLERDLDLIAAPWVENAIGPYGLALHIAAGLGGEVVDYKNQDKPCGRWSCNIHTPDWTKMIDLSVMPPPPAVAGGVTVPSVDEIEAIIVAAEPDIPASVDGTRIWTRRMAKGLHSALTAALAVGEREGRDGVGNTNDGREDSQP